MHWLIVYDTREVFEFLKRKGRMLVHQGLRLEEMYHGKVYLIEPLQPESFRIWVMRSGKRNTVMVKDRLEVFSAVKRCFGETVRSASVEGMVLEEKIYVI